MVVVDLVVDKGNQLINRAALLKTVPAHARAMLKVWAEIEKAKVEAKTEGDYEYVNTS